MTTELSCDVVIVGGGVAGGGLANHLGLAGLDVIVVEANPVIPIINRGDHISPPSVRMLDELGALPYFFEREAIKIHRWKAVGPEGEVVADVDFREFLDEPYNYILGLPHHLIHDALLNAADRHENVRIIRGFRAQELLEHNGAAAGVRGRYKGGRGTVAARLVAGCDGPHSMTRDASGIATAIHEHSYHYLMLTCSRHANQDGDYHHEFWTRAGFMGMFPLGTDRVRVPIAAQPGDMAHWQAAGLDTLKDQIADQWLPAWAAQMWREMEILGDDLHFYKVTRHHAASYVADGVVLLGDAAHTTPPYLGMGMNMGLRDGYYAARAIGAALSAGDVSTEALSDYEERCREFNQFVIDACENYGSVAAAGYHTHGEVEKALATSSALSADVLGRTYEPYV
jgi:6-methylpretetramide 4-monooxygenase